MVKGNGAASTCCGASVGYTSAGDSISDAVGHSLLLGMGSVLLNGLQLITCALPSAGMHTVTRVEAKDVDAVGVRGGSLLDVLFTTAVVQPQEGYEFQAQLVVETMGGCSDFRLGTLRNPGENVHLSRFVLGVPLWFTFTVSQIEIVPSALPAEEQFVAEMREALEDPITNRHRGSVSQVILNNRAKSSPLYEEVVGKLFNGMWLEFLMKNSNDFSLFRYSSQEIRDLGLSPHIKRSDVRVYLASEDITTIFGADQAAEAGRRSAEESTKLAVRRELLKGEITQRQLLRELRGHKGFASTLYPTLTLLLRFLGRHRQTFTWTSAPDQPTRVGVRGSRASRHEAPAIFADHDLRSKALQSCLPYDCQPPRYIQYRHDPYSADAPFAYLAC